MSFNQRRQLPCRRAHLAATGLAACALALLSCRVSSERPDVVLLTLDTLNLSRTPFGDPASSELSVEPTAMPNLAGLVARGTRFRQSHTSVPLTLPAHVTMLTGRSPATHGVFSNHHVVPTQPLELPRLLSKNGYETAAFVSLGVLNRSSGLQHSFDHFDDGVDDSLEHAYRRSPQTLNDVEEFLARRPSNAPPLFLWVHLADPHEPYLERQPSATVRIAIAGQEHRLPLHLHRRSTASFALGPGTHELLIGGLEAPAEQPSVGTFLNSVVCNFQPDTPAPDFSHEETPCGEFAELDRPARLSDSEQLSMTVSVDRAGTLEVGLDGRRFPSLPELARRYDSELGLLDESVGRLVESVRQATRPTVWAVLSDHGEGLGEHRIRGHAEMVWEEQLETLFAIVSPDAPEGTRSAPGVLHEDLLPTLAELLDLEVPRQIDGTSLASCLRAEEELHCTPRRTWSAYALRHSSHRLIRAATYAWPLKAVWQRGKRQRVFDLSANPAENFPVDRQSGQAVVLRRGANEAVATWMQLFDGSASPEGSSQRRRLLERLGYL